MTAPKAQQKKLIIVGLLGVGLMIALLTQPAPPAAEPTGSIPLTPVSLATQPTVLTPAGAAAIPPMRPTTKVSLETMVICNPFLAPDSVSNSVESEQSEHLQAPIATEAVATTKPMGALMAVYGTRKSSRALVGESIVREGDRLESGEAILQIESRSLRLGVAGE